MRTIQTVLLMSALTVTGCGGGSEAPDQPFTFTAVGVVTDIEDGNGMVAFHPQVNVGDTYTVQTEYDPALFTDAGVMADGRNYDAHDGARLLYVFESGYMVVRVIGGVRARENGGKGQWNWKGPNGELWFQANESVGSSFGGSFPADFESVHDVFMSSQASFDPNSTALKEPGDDPESERRISFSTDAMTVVAN